MRLYASSTHPVTNPIIVANIDEHPNATLEQRADVVPRRHMVRVLRELKALADVCVAGGEVGGDGGVDAELLADLELGEVLADVAIGKEGEGVSLGRVKSQGEGSNVHGDWVAKRGFDGAIAGLADIIRIHACDGVRGNVQYLVHDELTSCIERLLELALTNGGSSTTVDCVVLVDARLLEPLRAALDLFATSAMSRRRVCDQVPLTIVF